MLKEWSILGKRACRLRPAAIGVQGGLFGYRDF